jgi:hypothetical protein
VAINKKGHGKPIRRLAMTSILKQNTLVVSCPPVTFVRIGVAAPGGSRRIGSARRLIDLSRQR